MGPAEAIRDLVEPPLAAAGLELWDIEITTGLVRVLVDRPGGIDLEALSESSALLSPLLDEHPELMPVEAYQLEVSSPGVERTLRTPEQYRRYVGQLVSVKTTEAVSGTRRIRGTLSGVDDTSVQVVPEDGPGIPLAIPLRLISRARTVLVWGPAPKPGKAPARRAGTPVSTSAPVPPASPKDTRA